jgi:hypothetical protein
MAAHHRLLTPPKPAPAAAKTHCCALASREISDTNQYLHTKAPLETQPPATGFISNHWWLVKIAENLSIGMDMYFLLAISWICPLLALEGKPGRFVLLAGQKRPF